MKATPIETPVSSRTRQKEAEMYRVLHEQIKSKKDPSDINGIEKCYDGKHVKVDDDLQKKNVVLISDDENDEDDGFHVVIPETSKNCPVTKDEETMEEANESSASDFTFICSRKETPPIEPIVITLEDPVTIKCEPESDIEEIPIVSESDIEIYSKSESETESDIDDVLFNETDDEATTSTDDSDYVSEKFITPESVTRANSANRKEDPGESINNAETTKEKVVGKEHIPISETIKVSRERKNSKDNRVRIRKRKRGKQRKKIDHEMENIIAASILNNDNEFHDERDSTLPLKFTFGRQTLPPVKTAEDLKVEALWNEMALFLDSINGRDGKENDKEDSDPTTPCLAGEHHFIIDDEIGIKCTICDYVKLEIKYCIPPMCENPWGTQWRERESSTQKRQRQADDILFGSALDPQTNPRSGSSGSIWDLVEDFKSKMHPHQIEGFEFLWKTISAGNGCIISHAPGTGKTLLAIVFLLSYVRAHPQCRPLIIAPSNMLKTWESEFNKWKVNIPFHNFNSSAFTGRENLKLPERASFSSASVRLLKLSSWKKNDSVLAISYKLFADLTSCKRRRSDIDTLWETLLRLPQLIILDEGHTPRNSRSLIFQALSKITTSKKIILSGTPFQNNFEELFNLLRLVTPHFEGEQLQNLTNCNNIGDDAVEKLRKQIDPFVHVHKGSILKENLPGLTDTLIILSPKGIQRELLDQIEKAVTNHSLDYQCAVSLCSVHPFLLSTKVCKPENIELDLGELRKYEMDPNVGVKTMFVMELVRLSNIVNEKVLVFSQYIEPLNLISKQLQKALVWREGREILMMHGRCNQNSRQRQLKNFNDTKNASKVMLASTKACSEGICMVGASRVVLLDVVWNPSVEKQAISRAYRLGQQKFVYIYHLLAYGTAEEHKYRCQTTKDRLSEMVFYSADDGSNTLPHVTDTVLDQMIHKECFRTCFHKIVFQPKESNFLY